MQDVPKDPWGNDYFFDTDYDLEPGGGTNWAVVLGSYGPSNPTMDQYGPDVVIYTIMSEH
jgi:hypothetical protein